MSGVRPKYGKKYTDEIIDVEEEHPGDWNEALSTHRKEEDMKATIEKQMIDNVMIASDPLYAASLTILSNLCSNSAPKFINMKTNSKISLAKEIAVAFIEEMRHE
jgi:hypothetical protein